MELNLRDLTIGYKKGEPLCSHINATAHSGQAVALIGSNGAGKSTLLRTITGLIPINEGSITLDKEPINEMQPGIRAQKLAFVSTEIVSAAYMSVQQIISLGRVPYSGWAGKLSAEDKKVVETAMQQTQTTELSTRSVDTLSDGQRQRVMIARALAQDTPLLILDEPTAFLDPENREMVIRLIERLAVDMNKIVLYSTHEVEIASRHCHSIWKLDQQKLAIIKY